MRVGAYVRVSTQEQAKEGYSIEAQTERLRNYCQAKEWTLCHVYTDPGFSGAKIKRPALQNLIEDVKNHNIDIVIVYKLDRLSRSQKDTLYLIEDVFLKNGVDFVSLNENFDTSTAFGRAMIGILSVFAQLEREQIKERTQMGRAERAKKGLWHGGGAQPIGYDYDPDSNQLIINEYEAMQVREAFDMFANENAALTKILKTFNDNGYKHKNGNWGSGTNLKYLLSNPLYIGRIKWGGNEYAGQHPPIISDETFKRAQKRLAERNWRMGTPSYTPFSSTQLLTGLLFCKNCGARYYGAGAYRGSKKLPYSQRNYIHIYMCYSRSKTKKDMIKDPNCKNKNWRSETLDAYVINAVAQLESENGLFERMIQKERGYSDTTDKQRILKHKIEDCGKQIEKLLDLYQFQNVPATQIADRIKQFTDEKELLQKSLQDLTNVKESKISHNEARRLLNGATEVLLNASIEEKRTLLQTLIKRIELSEDNVFIQWSFL